MKQGPWSAFIFFAPRRVLLSYSFRASDSDHERCCGMFRTSGTLPSCRPDGVNHGNPGSWVPSYAFAGGRMRMPGSGVLPCWRREGLRPGRGTRRSPLKECPHHRPRPSACAACGIFCSRPRSSQLNAVRDTGCTAGSCGGRHDRLNSQGKYACSCSS